MITKCDGITNRDRLQSDTVHGVQSTKVIYCNRFSFLLSIYNVNIFNERINILEYPEFVIDLDLWWEFSIWEYISLNILETALDKGFIEDFLEAIMYREPTGFLCNLGIQYIIGKLLYLLLLNSLRRVLYSKLSWIISSWFLLIFSYVSFPASKIPTSFKIIAT